MMLFIYLPVQTGNSDIEHTEQKLFLADLIEWVYKVFRFFKTIENSEQIEKFKVAENFVGLIDLWSQNPTNNDTYSWVETFLSNGLAVIGWETNQTFQVKRWDGITSSAYLF